MLSGVNRGHNVAEDVTYSGTIAGAIEGTMLGIPSIALSQAYGAATGSDPHWDTALQARARTSSARVLADGMPRDVLVNVNFPDCAPDEVKGIAVTQPGQARPGACCASSRATTAAAIRITGSPSSATGRCPRATAPTSRRSPTTASR